MRTTEFLVFDMEDPWSDAETNLGKDLEISERYFFRVLAFLVSWRREKCSPIAVRVELIYSSNRTPIRLANSLERDMSGYGMPRAARPIYDIRHIPSVRAWKQLRRRRYRIAWSSLIEIK